jgi:hypothetical protein
MKIGYALAAAAIVLVAVVMLIRWRTIQTHDVRIADLPRVLSQLRTSTSFPAYAMLTFSPPDNAGPSVVSLQFSVENGRLGFDWVLYQKRNITDQERFLQYAGSAGFSPRQAELNGVKYLRVENGDLVGLSRGILIDMYRVPETAPLELIAEGFEWSS